VNATFKVDWRRVFRSLAVFMSASIILGVFIPVSIDSLLHGSRRGKVSAISVLIFILLFAPVFSIAFAFLISQWFRLASITVSEGVVEGRTYWGRKNKIPLSDITKLTRFSSKGIRAIVVHSRYHGKIYISDKTERLSELIAILTPYVRA
jgi:hypothetical protein